MDYSFFLPIVLFLKVLPIILFIVPIILIRTLYQSLTTTGPVASQTIHIHTSDIVIRGLQLPHVVLLMQMAKDTGNKSNNCQ